MSVGPGTVLGGRYRLTEHIAGGGMGDVWRGVDDVLARTIAVKILLPSLVAEQGFAARFRDEARTMATINHPGVVDVYDYGTDNGVTYLVMEYVEGDALSKTLGRVGRLTPQRTMSLIAQAADALQAAHDKGIVHRDVKPANLLVRPNGTLVLTDFGIARREAAASNLTAVGSVLGTASYLSPEQASGHGATPLSDVYALGVVAYQCLAGRRPFEGGTPIEIAVQHVEATPPPLPPDIPPPIRALVERCLAKPPAARFPSAAALASAARAAGAGQAPPPARPTKVQPVSPAGGSAGAGVTATRPMSGTQIMAPQSPAAYPQYRAGQPQGRGAAQPARSRPAAVILGIVLALVVMLLAALIASVIKRNVYATDGAPGPAATEFRVTALAVPPGGGQIGDGRPARVEHSRSIDHAMTEGLMT
ncbi:MAG TPA: serine/threonine-protein kinase [Micromonosporaceae bacterium]|jgi:serine/threonine-protein kinase|nr:serine/threonine-protein kinase [Micromonosporaceae bacterium]